MRSSVCIDAPVERVWEQLARLEDLVLWSELVLSARCEPQRSRGVGAQRVCELKGGVTITERWLAWDEGRSFTYESEGLPLVRQARNHWSVSPEGTQTLLTSEASVTLKGGLFGRLLEPVVRWQSRRLARRSSAAFKFLVETGEPAQGKHSRLPEPAALC